MAVVDVPITDATGGSHTVRYTEGPSSVLIPSAPKESDGSALQVRTLGQTRHPFSLFKNPLAPDTSETLVKIEEPCILEQFTWATDGRTIGRVRILVRNPAGWWHSLGDIKADGSADTHISPEEILNEGSRLFNILKWDNVASTYKFELKHPIKAAQGVEIILQNSAMSTPIKISGAGLATLFPAN